MSIQLVDPSRVVESHGEALFRHALRRLRRRVDAEDAVQETLLVALRQGDRYRGEADERGWLMGILRHKIADRRRAARRETTSAHADDEGWWDARGRWLRPPGRWSADPHELCQDAEFGAVLRGCLGGLPRRQAEALVLRSAGDADTEQVAQRLGITLGNLGVLLHRARLRLRECLERRWFQPGAAP